MTQSENPQLTLVSNQVNSNKSDLGSLSLKDMFFKYIRYIPLFIISIAFALLAAFIYLRYATRIYSASGNLLIKSEARGSDNDKVEDILMGNNRSQNIQSEIEILKSRPLMTRVVNKLNLQFTYAPIGKIMEDLNVYKYGPFLIEAFEIKDSSSAFSTFIQFINKDQFRVNNEPTTFTFEQIFENKYGVFKLKRNKRAPLPDSRYKVTWQPAEVVAGALVNGLKVLPKTPGTGIVAIGIETTNGRMAADVVNTLMVEYDSMTIEQSNYSTDQMLGFIDSRLRFLNRELDSVQLNLLNFQQKNNLIDIEAQSGGSFEKITEVDKAVVEQQMKASVTDLIHGYLLDKRNQYNNVVVPSSLGLEDVTLNELVSNYNNAQLTRQSLLASDIPPDNPAVKESEGQIEKLRQSVIENLKNIKSSYSTIINTLQKRNQTEQSQFQTLPYKLKEYVELQRQVNTKLALYSLLEGKREEAAISRASTISNSKLIDRARASDTPVKPNRKAVQVMAALIGLVLPALFIFLKEILNDKITTRFDIERVSQVPILGEIGHSFSKNTLIVNKTSRSMVAEQFRIIRSNLQYVLNKIERPVILITSSFSGEGKSFVSTNMASVMALTGKKTIILEFDIRKPKILTGLGINRKPGISNFLVGKAELKDLVIPVPDQENLFLLSCGPIPPNPSELLLDQKVTELFEWVRKEFDVILVDTAPVGMVSDAMTLGRFADCTLYLVRQGRTFKKQVGLIDDLHRENKLPRISIVINDVKVKPGYGYYGYGRYGYGYGYGQGQGNYYEEERPPQSVLEKMISKLDFRNWVRK